MINDLDQSLNVLLQHVLPTLGRDNVEVSFAPPDNNFSAKLPAVNFFLYDLRENLELRSNDETLRFNADRTKAARVGKMARIDASYLITAWAGGSSADSHKDEHRLLGAVMIALLRHRTLPQEFLQGSLSTQDLPVPVSVLQPGRLQSLGEFWQAIGGKPKAALNYTVTLAVDLSDPVEWGIVTEREVRIGPVPGAPSLRALAAKEQA